MLAGFDISLSLFAAAMVFARMGGILMLMPGIGETSIPVRLRLAFALAFCFVIGPIVAPSLPAPPDTLAGLGVTIGLETLIGVMIGAASRILLTAGAIAGQIIGYQTGLAMAQSFDPAQGQAGVLPAQFLNLIFIVIVLVTPLHQEMLLAAAGSYELMPAGQPPLWGDAAFWALELFIDAFTIGVQIASPLIVFGLVFYLGLGVLSRLMPQAQIFFIAMPLNILIGFSIMAMSLGAMVMLWTDRYERFASTLN
ncbi:flagellar biosynthetic protein FliR [Oceanicaulis sp. LC35]|uniref:flagellar biosynthetic protein FliR n=1 Tax=Oceanicaulis sp. LC35 TaxID=3349635 RepID=UPI003F85DBB0